MTKKRLALGGLIGLAGVIVVAFVTYIGYFAISGRALPHTHVGHINVGGMSVSEIESKLSSHAATMAASISGDGINKSDATLADMGASLDSKTTARKAVAEPRKSAFSYVTSIFASTSVTADVTFDDLEKTKKFAESLTANQPSATLPVPPRVEAKDGTFVVVPGTSGRGVSIGEVKRAAQELADAQKSIPITITSENLPAEEPSVELKKLAETANTLVANEVAVTTGEDVVTADVPTKTTWIISDGKKLDVKRDALTEWVKNVTKVLESDETVGVRYKNTAGEIIRVGTQAVSKKVVSNIDDMVSKIATNLLAGQPSNVTAHISEEEKHWEDHLVAAGAENLAYPAAEGEKWIDVNLSNFTIIGYEGAKAVRGPIPLIPGATETPTVTGTFKVWLKNASQTMRGTNLDGTRYEAKGVPWIMYFHGDYAIHGAPWFKNFGFHAGANGSHGCINVSVNDAKSLYDWAPLGTVVVSHY